MGANSRNYCLLFFGGKVRKERIEVGSKQLVKSRGWYEEFMSQEIIKPVIIIIKFDSQCGIDE